MWLGNSLTVALSTPANGLNDNSIGAVENEHVPSIQHKDEGSTEVASLPLLFSLFVIIIVSVSPHHT